MQEVWKKNKETLSFIKYIIPLFSLNILQFKTYIRIVERI